MVELKLPVTADRIRRKGFLDELFQYTIPHSGNQPCRRACVTAPCVAAPCRRARESLEPRPEARGDRAMPARMPARADIVAAKHRLAGKRAEPGPEPTVFA